MCWNIIFQNEYCNVHKFGKHSGGDGGKPKNIILIDSIRKVSFSRLETNPLVPKSRKLWSTNKNKLFDL